jgi:hypothetical protein
MRTRGVAPICLSCGTEGGRWNSGEMAPVRTRGLCGACYDHHADHGTLKQYPHQSEHDPAVVLAAPYSEAQRRRVAFCDRDGNPQRRALPFAPGYDPAEVIRDAETFAAKWLERNPAYIAKWCADEARAA